MLKPIKGITDKLRRLTKNAFKKKKVELSANSNRKKKTQKNESIKNP